MKYILTVIIVTIIITQGISQKQGIYSANSAWVRINTKSKVNEPTIAEKLTKKLVLIEDAFTKPENSYGWRTTELNGATYQRGSGTYKINNTAGLSDIITAIEANCNLDSVDFLLEVKIVTKGETPPRAGIVWGYRDKDNYMAFKINSLQQYAYIFMNSGENVEDSGFIHTKYVFGTFDNKLTVKKQGIKLIFYMNDVKVSEGDYGNMSSSRIGLIMSDNETVFKDFRFQQLSKD